MEPRAQEKAALFVGHLAITEHFHMLYITAHWHPQMVMALAIY